MNGTAAVLVFVGLFVLVVLGGIAVASERRTDLSRLGDLRGRPMSEVTAVIGDPNARSANADGSETWQWIDSRRHIALVVDPAGRCLGIAHQFDA